MEMHSPKLLPLIGRLEVCILAPEHIIIYYMDKEKEKEHTEEEGYVNRVEWLGRMSIDNLCCRIEKYNHTIWGIMSSHPNNTSTHTPCRSWYELP